MSDEKTGGSIFPTSPIYNGDDEVVKAGPGMTLRDYFAAQAIPTALQNKPFIHPRDSWQGDRLNPNSPAYREAVSKWRAELAEEAFALADALLAERSK